MLTTPGGRPDLVAQLGEAERGERGELRGLEHHRVSHRERGRDLPRQHEQREVPGNDLADDADRPATGQLALHELRPAGVVVEVARHQRHVDVARLADRLAVVERLEHREEPAVLLDLARERVEIARPRVPAERPPPGLRRPRRVHRAIHIGRGRLRQTWRAACRSPGLIVSNVSPPGRGPRAADELAEPPPVRAPATPAPARPPPARGRRPSSRRSREWMPWGSRA